MVTATERSQLAAIAYNKDLTRDDKVGHWTILQSEDFEKSGLQIAALIDKSTKHIEFIVAGTNDIKDIGPDADFVTGGYDEQFRQAVEFVNDYVRKYEEFHYTFGTSGHSLGGGLSQVLSYTFGFEGLTIDAPPAWRIVESQGYQQHMIELGRTPQGTPDTFVNYTEDGSRVSFQGKYLGSEVEIDLVPNTLSDISTALFIAGATNPAFLAPASYLLVKDQFLGEVNQHDKEKFTQFFASLPDPDKLGIYEYANGNWFSNVDSGGDYLSSPSRVEVKDFETLTALNTHRELMLENNRVLEEQGGYHPLWIIPSSQVAIDITSSLPEDWSGISYGGNNVFLQHDDGSQIRVTQDSVIYSYSDGRTEVHTRNTDGSWNYYELIPDAPDSDPLVQTQHIVVGGESLSSIADTYDTSIDNLLLFNPELANHPDSIQAGDIILLRQDTAGSIFSGEHIRVADSGQITSDVTPGIIIEQTQVREDAEPESRVDEKLTEAIRADLASDVENDLQREQGAIDPLDLVALDEKPDTTTTAVQQAIIAQHVISSLQAASTFFQGLDSGDTRALISSGINLANLLDGYSVGTDLHMDGAANAINLVNRIGALSDALHDGDTLEVMQASFNLGSSTANILAKLGTDTEPGSLVGSAGELGGYLSSAAALVSLIQNIDDGEYAAAISDGMIAYATAAETAVATGLLDASYTSANPYLIAASMVINMVLQATADEPYRTPAGNAYLTRTELYRQPEGDDLSRSNEQSEEVRAGLTLISRGQNGNDLDRFSEQLGDKWDDLQGVVNLKSGGASIAGKVLTGLVDRLQQDLPDGAGIVPERLPSVSFNGDHFVVSFSNPITGEEINIPTTPGAVMDTLVNATHAAQAVVPEWELETIEAKYAAYREQVEAYEAAQRQADFDMVDNDLIPPQADYWQPDRIQADALNLVNSTRQVSIADLDNDGVDLLRRAVRFDMDDDGFLEVTDWASSDDALVAIDRNLNNHIDTGSDLFAGNFDWLDVDSDGRFTPDDPAFAYMRLWQDRNSNGDNDAGEMLTLAELGVESIYEQEGSLYGHKANGEVIPIVVRDLGFDANGELHVRMPDGGTLTLNESGEAVWSGGSVTDLSGMLTTGGGNVSGAPVFVLSDEDDVISGNTSRIPPIIRELRRITRTDSQSIFTGPMAAILAMGLGISCSAHSTMIQFDLEHAAEVLFRGRSDEDHAEVNIGPNGQATSPALSTAYLPVTGGDLIERLAEINQSGGILTHELVSHLQAMLSTDTFDFGVFGLTRGNLEDVFQLLVSLDFADHERSPDESDVFPNASVVDADTNADSDENDVEYSDISPDDTTTETPEPHINEVPRPQNDTLIVIEDVANVIRPAELLANDRDPDHDILKINAVMNAAHGQVELLPDGTIRFSPEVNYFGAAGFDYVVSDGQGGTAKAHASIDVLAMEDIPQLGNAILVGLEDRETVYSAEQLLSKDYDPDGDSLELLEVGNADHGFIELLADGSIRYTPEENYFGDVAFDYSATDGNGNDVTATAVLKVVPVNDVPVAIGEALTGGMEDTPFLLDPGVLLANDSDIEDEVLSVSAVSNARNGSVSLQADGQICFIPAQDFNGTAVFDYTVADTEGGMATATASIGIAAVNDTPVAIDDNVRVVSGGRNTIRPEVLLDNDSDVDGDGLSIISVSPAQHGSVQLGGSGDMYFTPDTGYIGTAGFDYMLDDGQGGQDSAHVSIEVVANTPPIVNGEQISTDEDTVNLIPASVLVGNDYDIDGQPLSIRSVDNALNGSVALDSDDTVRFTPDENFNGRASFDYIVTDGFGGEGRGTTTVNVQPVNDAPFVSNETITSGSEDALQVITAAALLANDTDIDGDVISLQSVQNARYGTATINASGDVIFNPSMNFNGVAAFDYTVSDGQGGTSIGTAFVNIVAVNDNPTAGADGLSAREDTQRIINPSELLRNDNDVDGDVLHITSVSGASHGSVQLSGGNVVYDPASNYSGSDSFRYTVSDGHGGSAIGLVSVSIAPVNDLPYYTIGKYTNQYDRHRTDGIVRATDPDGPDSLIRYSIPGSGQPLIGTASVNPTTGQWSYWSNHYNSYDGTIKFSITATDMNGGTAVINVPVHHFGGGPDVNHPYTVQQVYGTTSFLPVVLDLDNDGIELIPLEQSRVAYDTTGDGEASRIGWVSPDDGILAYNGNGDAEITQYEISFVEYSDGAETDLQGLKAFDSNNDGQLSDDDDDWESFVVWQDSDQNGISDANELNSLDDLKITSISLTSHPDLPVNIDSQVTAIGEFTYADGSQGLLADVAFDVVADDFLGTETSDDSVGSTVSRVDADQADEHFDDGSYSGDSTGTGDGEYTGLAAISRETDSWTEMDEQEFVHTETENPSELIGAEDSETNVTEISESDNGIDQTVDLLISDIASFDPPVAFEISSTEIEESTAIFIVADSTTEEATVAG